MHAHRSAVPIALLLAGLIPAGGCSPHPLDVALGSAFEVAIVSDPSLAAARERARALLEQVVYLSFREEQLYHTEEVSVGETPRIPWQSRKSVLILGAGPYSGPLAAVLDPKLTPAQRQSLRAAGEPGAEGHELQARLFRLSDPWARFQSVTVLWAPTTIELERTLQERGGDVLRFVEDGALNVLGRTMLERGEQEDLRLELQREYGWGLRVPTAFRADTTNAPRGFTSFRADDPPRLIFVYWTAAPAELPDGEQALQLRDRIGERFYQGDRVVMERSDASRVEFLGRPAVYLDGQWENRGLVIGGPFRSYLFLEPEQNRLYLVDVAVYAPGMEKLLPLREAEAIARTFTVVQPSAEGSRRAG